MQKIPQEVGKMLENLALRKEENDSDDGSASE